MRKRQAIKSRPKGKPASTGRSGSRRILLIGTGILVLAVAGWFAWNSLLSTRILRAGPAETLGAPLSEIASDTNDSELIVPLSNVAGTNLGQVAPDFTVPTLDGGTFRLIDQRGKPAIIFFMAYWCGTCIPEARALAQLEQEYGEQISIIAVDVDPTSTPDALASFKQATDNGAYTWAFDTGQQVTNAYQVRALDTTLILDAEGHVVYSDAYPTSYEILKDTLAGLGL